MRKLFSNGFSAQALAAQEDYVHRFVDIMIRQLHKNSLKTSTDIVSWYNYVTFDIIGELAFGEAFGSLESGKHRTPALGIG
jgi:cytochrome P450